MENVTKVCVLSKSKVKGDAVKRWLRRSKRNWMQVTFIDSQATDCPQPLGQDSAMQCLFKRLPKFKSIERNTMYVGIENYISQDADGRWRDKVAVSVTYVTNNGVLLHTATIGQFDNVVPRRFEPRTLPDVVAPLGYSVTVGARIHAAYPDIAHDDWATEASMANIDRGTQIVDALRCLDEKLNSFVTF